MAKPGGKAMKELDYQKLLSEDLNKEFERLKIDAKAYQGNQFKNIEKGKSAKRPDLIIFHNINKLHPITKEIVLESPIGIEFKLPLKFDRITKGVLDQIKGRYSNETYYLGKDKTKPFKLKSLAFATTTSCSEEKVYSKLYPEASNFFIERFCWRAGVSVLFKGKEFYWSYRNYRFNLNNKPIGRCGKGGVWIMYD